MFADAGLVTLTAFVSPYRRDRDAVRASLAAGDFIEVFVNVPLEVAEARDPKGLYKKARSGEIKHFTGIDSPYEAPLHPDLVVDAHHELPDVGVRAVLDLLLQRGLLDAR